MKKIIFLFFIFCTTHFAWAEKKNNVYQYVADLIHVENNRIKVKLTTPTIETEEIIFFIPNSIPGTYEIFTYGRFICNVQAWTKDNKELEVEKLEVGSWKIKNATLLAKLTYEVLETDPNEIRSIAEGTDFIEKEHFLINNYCLFGYFQGLEKLPYVVTYLHPSGLYGATALKTLTSRDTSDTYIISSYKELADSPIMYNALDTTSFTIGGAEIIISVYSPSKLLTARKIGVPIREIINKASCYFNGEFPLKKYVFLIKGIPSTSIQASGLEHSFSSIIELSDREITPGFSNAIQEVTLHEFLHIQTPLAIRSEEIEYFDFHKPVPSKHLWLYEGVTEYNAWSILVKSGLLSEQEFIHQVRRTMLHSSYFNDTISLTELSKNSLDKYSDQYYNVYLKGFLTAMCLDLKLLDLSNGKFGIKEMIEQLERIYKKGTPFKDDELFDQIATLSGYSEIKNYFNQYIEKSTPIPYKDFLELAGFNYKPIGEEKVYTFGASFSGFIIDGSTIDKIGEKLGYQTGDRIISMNGVQITDDLLAEHYPFISKKNKKIEVVVARRNSEGKEEEIILQTKNKKIKKQIPHSITSKRRLSKKQKMIRKEWLHNMRSKISCNY